MFKSTIQQENTETTGMATRCRKYPSPEEKEIYIQREIFQLPRERDGKERE